MKTEEFESQMLKYLDGTMPEREVRAFEDALSVNPILKKKLDDFTGIERFMKTELTDHPSKNFTERVMRNLQNPVQTKRSMTNGIFLLLGIVVMTGLCAFLSYAGFFDSTRTTIDLQHVAPIKTDFNLSLPSVSLSGKLIMNIVIFLNLFLALLLFDRVVLKTMFNRRMREG